MPLLYFLSTLKAVRVLGCNAVCERSASNEIGTMIDSVLQVPLLAMIIDKQGSALSTRQADILVATRLGPVPEPCRHNVVCVSRVRLCSCFIRWQMEPECEHAGIASSQIVSVGSLKKCCGFDMLLEAYRGAAGI